MLTKRLGTDYMEVNGIQSIQAQYQSVAMPFFL